MARYRFAKRARYRSHNVLAIASHNTLASLAWQRARYRFAKRARYRFAKLESLSIGRSPYPRFVARLISLFLRNLAK